MGEFTRGGRRACRNTESMPAVLGTVGCGDANIRLVLARDRSRGTEYDERNMTNVNAFDEARARLIGESTDRDWYDLWPRVTSARAELLRALEGVTDETAAERPGDREGEAAWSIAEVVRHALMYSRNVRRSSKRHREVSPL